MQPASSWQAVARRVPVPISFSRISLLALVLLSAILQSTFALAPIPRILKQSPFSNRIQAEANALQLTCRLLNARGTSSQSIAAVVHTDVSGSLAHNLHQFCGADRSNSDNSPLLDAQILSFGSRTALRTSLLLRRVAQTPRPFLSRAPTSRFARIEGCCQPSSDVDDLSFPPSCCEEPREPAIDFRSDQRRAAPQDSISFFLEFGRFTPPRSLAISAALVAAASESGAGDGENVHLVELQWDMQTGNFFGPSLQIIAAATTFSSKQLSCLSALVASGNRCLKTPCAFSPLLFLLYTCSQSAISSISSLAQAIPIISIDSSSFLTALMPFATVDEAYSSLRLLCQHSCPAFMHSLSFVHIFKPPTNVLAAHAFLVGSADAPQDIDPSVFYGVREQVSAFFERQSSTGVCGDAVVFNFENPSLHGHGAQAHTLLMAAKLSHLMNRVLVINGSAPWAFNSGNLSLWGGLLRDISSCTLASSATESEDPENVLPGQTLVLRSGSGSKALTRHDLRGHHLGSGARSPMHLAYLHGMLLTWLLSPSQKLKIEVTAFMRASSLTTGNFVVAHLRRGHKFVEATAASLRSYADAIAAASLATHVSVALLITEDNSGAAELPLLLNRMGIRTVLLNCTRHKLKISIPLAIQLRVLDADTENSQSLINLFAASHAAAVIGTFSSGYSRLIFELACAHFGRIVPHRSLDLKYFV